MNKLKHMLVAAAMMLGIGGAQAGWNYSVVEAVQITVAEANNYETARTVSAVNQNGALSSWSASMVAVHVGDGFIYPAIKFQLGGAKLYAVYGAHSLDWPDAWWRWHHELDAVYAYPWWACRVN